MHQNVLAKWPDDGVYYPAQIFGASRGKYNVYWPQDREVVKGMSGADIKLPPDDPQPNWAKCTRKEYFQLEFVHDDPNAPGTPRRVSEDVCGKYQVLKLGTGTNINKYVCTRENRGLEHFYFDVGYVQEKLLKAIFPLSHKA